MNKRYFSGQKGASGLQFSCDDTFLLGAEIVAARWRRSGGARPQLAN
jgi:hypothetical protein